MNRSLTRKQKDAIIKRDGGKCSVLDCNKNARSGIALYCEMHYYRVRRNGTTGLMPDHLRKRRRRVYGETSPHSGGYVLIYVPGHPMVIGRRSTEYQHRIVFYDAHGQGPFNCHWCGKSLSWATVTIDHMNEIKSDNRIRNLVPACLTCNQARGLPKMRHKQRSQGRLLTLDGQTKCLYEWASQIGISHQSLHVRIRNGWPIRRALTEGRGRFGPK